MKYSDIKQKSIIKANLIIKDLTKYQKNIYKV